MCNVKGSPNPIIEKMVENKGTKNRKLLEIVAPRKFKLLNHNPNDPIDAETQATKTIPIPNHSIVQCDGSLTIG